MAFCYTHMVFADAHIHGNDIIKRNPYRKYAICFIWSDVHIIFFRFWFVWHMAGAKKDKKDNRVFQQENISASIINTKLKADSITNMKSKTILANRIRLLLFIKSNLFPGRKIWFGCSENRQRFSRKQLICILHEICVCQYTFTENRIGCSHRNFIKPQSLITNLLQSI